MVTSDLSDCTRALKLAKLSSIPRPGNEKEGVICPSCGLGGLTAAPPRPPSAARCAYTIPGHSALISHVKFQPEHGHYLMTASYDNKVKLWSMRDHSLIKTMEGHEGRVMCADASDDGKYFATSAMDRTWKLWGR